MKNERLENSLQASADSVSASNPLDGQQPGKSNSTPSSGLCLVTDFPLPNNLRMSVQSANKTFAKWIASQRDSPAPTSQTSDPLKKGEALDSRARAVDSSPKSYVYSKKFNPAGWSLKTSRRCSIQTIAQTLRKSSVPLPTAGMWDSGECLMLSISASPKSVSAFSWSPVLERCPPWTCYLTPPQWRAYLARLHRSKSYGGKPMLGLGILRRQRTSQAESVLGVSFSLLSRTDGVRWLSGRESLSRQGFPSDWMRPTLWRLSLPETPSAPGSQLGSLKSSLSKLVKAT